MSDPIPEIIEHLFAAKLPLAEVPEEIAVDDRFWVISGDHGPRWIIPYRPQWGLPVVQQWRPYGATSALKWAVLKQAYALGQLHRLPNVRLIGVAGAASCDWQHLGYTDRQALVPSIYIGTPGSTRKAVVTLVNPQQSAIVGVAKIPLGNLAQDNILREAGVLTQLAAAHPGLGPRCLFADLAKGLMVQEVLLGRPVERRLTSAHLQWLTQLHHPSHRTSIQTQAKVLAQRFAQVESLAPEAHKLLGRALLNLNDTQPLPLTWVHGDFAPWNLKWVPRMGSAPNRTLVAVDWEDAQPEGLPLYDLFHYQYMQSYLFQSRRSALTALRQDSRVNAYLQGQGISETQFAQLALYYLIDMWVQSTSRCKVGDAHFFKTEAQSMMAHLS